MAVTKIRKLSSMTLLVLTALSVIIFLVFFLGGSTVDAKNNTDYKFTGLLLFWGYFLFCATTVAALFFAGRSLLTDKSKDKVASRAGMIAVCVLLVSLVLGYLIGSGDTIKGLNEASQTYNTSGWLKVTDMWLYSIYVLFIATVGAVVWGGLSSRLLKK